jgi:phage terminase Nu1 subunit (DNA packaging protein)
MNIEKPITQVQAAELFGVDQATVSRWVAAGILKRGGSGRVWIKARLAALQAEVESLTADGDDSAAGRAARLELTKATTELRRKQAQVLTRDYERAAQRYFANMAAEVRSELFQRIPTAVVGRLLAIIPKTEDRYAAADVFRDVVADALGAVQDWHVSGEGLRAEDDA